MLVGGDAGVVVGIVTRTCSVCGALVGLVVLVGSGIAVLVGGGVPVNSGVAVTTTTTGSGSMQATTSIAINAATVSYTVYLAPPPNTRLCSVRWILHRSTTENIL